MATPGRHRCQDGRVCRNEVACGSRFGANAFATLRRARVPILHRVGLRRRSVQADKVTASAGRLLVRQHFRNNMSPTLIISVLVVLGLAFVLASRPLLNLWQSRETARAIPKFKLQREQLEHRFFEVARTLGKPRGVRWLECDWQDRVTFGRDLQSGLLTAFVAVRIRFEAIEGGDMEDIAAVGHQRDASAVFHFQNGNWGTAGRALFNMDPVDAIERLEGQYERVETSH